MTIAQQISTIKNRVSKLKYHSLIGLPNNIRDDFRSIVFNTVTEAYRSKNITSSYTAVDRISYYCPSKSSHYSYITFPEEFYYKDNNEKINGFVIKVTLNTDNNDFLFEKIIDIVTKHDKIKFNKIDDTIGIFLIDMNQFDSKTIKKKMTILALTDESFTENHTTE